MAIAMIATAYAAINMYAVSGRMYRARQRYTVAPNSNTRMTTAAGAPSPPSPLDTFMRRDVAEASSTCEATALALSSLRLGGAILEFVALQCVTQLVVAEVQRSGGRALVESVSTQRILEKLTLIFRNGTAEIAGLRSSNGLGGRDD